jgi:NitT/TauT family transport system substrate-binding protein
MKPLRPHLCIACCLLLAWLAPAFGQQVHPLRDAPPGVSKKATFLPHWSPQAQFGGYFVAYEKGFYRDRGIDLEILRGGPDRRADEAVAKGRADFVTLFLTGGIALRAQGVKLVNIAQIVQRSALILVAKTSSGIREPRDLDGRTVYVWPAFELQPRLFFRRHGLRVQTVPQAGSASLFLRGGVDAMSAMLYNEYHALLSSGLDPGELTVFSFSEQGLNFPEDGIYCLEETLRRDPELCRQFVLASLEGWRYAFAHPQEALDIVMKYVDQEHLPTNRAHQKWMLEQMRALILPTGPDGDTAMGELSRAGYRFVAGQMLENDLIETAPDYEDFHAGLARHP